MSALDLNFVTFLSSRGIAEDEFRELKLEQKYNLIDAYEKRTGNNYDVFIMWLYLVDFI